MGHGNGQMTSARQEQAQRARELTAIYAVMCCLLFLLVIQFVLLMVGLEGFMAGHERVLLPAAAGSGICFAAACWLIRFVASAARGKASA